MVNRNPFFKREYSWLLLIIIGVFLNACGDPRYDNLLAWVKTNDIVRVDVNLNEGMDVNRAYYQYNTLLHFARSEEMAKLLIAHGAHVNAKNHRGNTPLHAASEQGLVGVVRTLLSSGADVNLPNNQGQTPLFWAAAPFPYDEDDFHERFVIEPGGWENKTEIVLVLMKHGANPYHKDYSDRDIFQIAKSVNGLDSPTMQAVSNYLSTQE